MIAWLLIASPATELHSLPLLATAVHALSSRAWFAGDSGYAPCFQEIGQRLGPFDLSIIPTGAYEPR